MAIVTIRKMAHLSEQLVEEQDKEPLGAMRINIDTESLYPDNIMLTLIYLTSKWVVFPQDRNDPYSLSNFQESLTKYGNSGYQRIIEEYWDLYRFQFRSQRKLLKPLLAPPAVVNGMPPKSTCQRCEMPLWDPQTDESVLKNLTPLYCLNCGQLFKYTDLDVLAVKESVNMAVYPLLVKRRQESSRERTLVS